MKNKKNIVEEIKANLKEIERLEKKEDKWICKICKKKYPSSAYCVENHFSKFHKDIKISDWTNDDFEEKGNWANIDLNEKEENKLKKCEANLLEIKTTIKSKLEDYSELSAGLNEYAKSNEVRVSVSSLNGKGYVSVTLKNYIKKKIADYKNALKLIERRK